MNCNECQKRPATLHFTQIVNGAKTEIHVCDVCAKQMGYSMHTEETFSLHDLLTGLFNFNSPQKEMQNQSPSFFQELGEVTCDKCHSTFNDFQRAGKFGCAHCYDAFHSKLDPILRRVHSGNTKHNGKIPKRKGGNLHVKKELELQRDYLQQLIADQNFEQAAIVRDKIKHLEQKKEGDPS